MRFFIPASFLLLTLVFVTFAQTVPDSDPVLQSPTTFAMPQSAIDAKIDGTILMELKIDKTGKVTKVEISGGAVWPCDTMPKKALEELSATLRETMMNGSFSPASKKGKPVDKEFWFTLKLRNPILEPQPVKPETGKSKVIRSGVLQGTATYLARPTAVGAKGAATVQLVVDEQGKVIRAGGIKGMSRLQAASREAACSSKFAPTLLEGVPIKIEGMITYTF